ncbi:MAG: exopolysaccharide biosynthesis polyprenyl glycosylphosphotransferase [bacterium]|nr:exopolysaccharide biosynthesis polyprenyl glycosylphosphotransferase [bacterium]
MKGYYSINLNKHRMKLFLFDFIMLFYSMIAAYFLRYALFGQDFAGIPYGRIAVYFFILVPQTSIMFYIMGFYERRGIANFSGTIIKLTFSLTLIGLLNAFVFYVYHTLYIGRVVFTLHLVLFFIMVGIGRYFIFKNIDKHENQNQLVLINLTPQELQMIKNEPVIDQGFRFIEFNFETQEELSQFITNPGKNKVDHNSIFVISAYEEKIDQNIDFFIQLKFDRYSVYDIETFYSNMTGKVPTSSMPKLWNLISGNEFVMGISSFYKIKRVLDIALSLLLLILTSPFFVLIPLFIKLSSRGPVFYIQERFGWNKKPFKLIKFRTMVADAEKSTGPQWASHNDSRITVIGKLLRYTRLDELPQLVNVLKSDMSFVGNRPIREHFSDQLEREINHYQLRYFIKPGITGWAQVKGSYAVPDGEQTLQYELFYLKNMSILFDLIIFLKTLKTIFNFKGR